MASAFILKRAATLDELRQRKGTLASEESLRRGISFRPRPMDVLIATYPKCGTTWMQQIVHGLRTRGSMDFDEITRVVPWIEMAFDMGLDIQVPQVAVPRAFKTHWNLAQVPQGGKYIAVVRDPKDAMLSLYRFFEGWMIEKNSISLPEFARGYYIE